MNRVIDKVFEALSKTYPDSYISVDLSRKAGHGVSDYRQLHVYVALDKGSHRNHACLDFEVTSNQHGLTLVPSVLKQVKEKLNAK